MNAIVCDSYVPLWWPNCFLRTRLNIYYLLIMHDIIMAVIFIPRGFPFQFGVFIVFNSNFLHNDINSADQHYGYYANDGYISGV